MQNKKRVNITNCIFSYFLNSAKSAMACRFLTVYSIQMVPMYENARSLNFVQSCRSVRSIDDVERSPDHVRPALMGLTVTAVIEDKKYKIKIAVKLSLVYVGVL